MSTNRVAVVEANLDAYLASAQAAPRSLALGEPLRAGSGLVARQAVELFEDQVLSRQLDVAARELKRTGRSFYTISSAGHEDDAVLGALLRLDDPCYLHYRSGGLMMARARKAPGETPVFDALLSLCASSEDPIAHGRHKVWGSRRLWVPPQTSTIASHVPKAVGMAFAIGRAARLSTASDAVINLRAGGSESRGTASDAVLKSGIARDSIVCCSFGDASVNHATALAGFNAARYMRKSGAPCPILLVCEDNGIGISVETPRGWIEETFGGLPHLAYVSAEGGIDGIWDAAAGAIERCRSTRAPVFLHLRCVRLWGHAGSDVETTYHTLEAIEAVEARDPLLENARRLIETGAATPGTLRAIVADARERVMAAAEEAARRPKLVTRAEVIGPMALYDEVAIRAEAARAVDSARRREHFGGTLPEEVASPTRRTLGAHVNSALHDEMLLRPGMLAFGEDAGRKGGVYGVTQGLQKRFGLARVFDTLLDETSILGLAQGLAQAGFLPVPEIQYLAYLHNALDQLRGEACSLSYFSDGQFTNPMVVRVQGLAYQKGFGGHFHNDNSVGALRDIPGLMLAVPARGDDAARMLRGAIATAKACGRVIVFLEPIALYHERDLYEEGDGCWLNDYPPPPSCLLPGEVGVYEDGERVEEAGARVDAASAGTVEGGARAEEDEAGDGARGIATGRIAASAHDLLIVTYGNGVRLSLRAARALEREAGVRARVIDLRWLSPLPHGEIARHAGECGRVLVVDECRATGGGIADEVIARLAEDRSSAKAASLRAADSYVPLGSATDAVLVTEAQIVEAARELCR